MGFATRVCIFLSAWILAAQAQALPRLQIHPVDLVGYAGDELRLEVELPCGAQFYGLIAQADRKAGALKIAAAVAVDSIVCTAMPETAEIRVDYIAVRGFKTITPMTVEEGSRLSIARISDLRLTRGTGAPALTAVYEPRCGRDMGTLIHRVGRSRLELAFVERAATGARADGACRPGQKARAITSLDMRAHFKVAALRDKPKGLSRTFTLRLAEVNPESLKTPAEGGLSLSYKHACNEAPVGMVMSAPLREDGAVRIQVGVLVARYDNYPCAPSKAGAWDELSEKDLILPDGAHAEALAATDGDDALRLGAPLKLARGTGVKSNALRVAYLDGCDDVFAVYSRDWRGALAVGVLRRGSGGSQCKKLDGEVSLSQPYIARSVPAGELYPMQLKGMTVH